MTQPNCYFWATSREVLNTFHRKFLSTSDFQSAEGCWRKDSKVLCALHLVTRVSIGWPAVKCVIAHFLNWLCDRTCCTVYCWSYLVQSSMVDWSQILHSLSMRLHFGSFTRSGVFVQNYLARCLEHWTLNNEHWTLHIVHAMLNINIEHWTMFMLHWTWSLSTLRWTSDFTSSSSDFLLDQAMDHKRQRIWDLIPFRIKCPAHIFSLSKRIPT